MKKAIKSTPSLSSVCELVADTHDCKIMTVKKGSEIALSSMGYFTGLETQFRIYTNASKHTLTVWRSDGKISQWEWATTDDTKIAELRDCKLTEGARAMISTVWSAIATLIAESRE